jgi:hypothetical protein
MRLLFAFDTLHTFHDFLRQLCFAFSLCVSDGNLSFSFNNRFFVFWIYITTLCPHYCLFFVLLHILHCMHVLHCAFCFSHMLFFFVSCFFSSSMFLKLFPFLLKIMFVFMCACLFELFFLCFVIVSLCAFAFYVPTLAFFPPPKHLSFFVHLLCLLLHSTYNYIIAFVVCTFFLCCFYITTSIFFFNFFFKSLYIYFKLFLFHVCKYCVVSFFFVYFIMYRCGFKSYIFKYFVVTLALNL